MLRSHLIVALRGLRRDARYTALNVVGLALALAVAFLVLAWVRGELAVDAWHERADRTYRVVSTVQSGFDPDPRLFASVPDAVPALARDEVPGVEAVAEVVGRFYLATAEGDEAAGGLDLGGVYADGALFDVFSLRLAEGDPETALAAPGRLVLSEHAARRLFGDADPMGRAVAGRDGAAFTVTGVLAEPAGRTHLPLEAIASLSTLGPTPPTPWDEAFGARDVYAYVVLDNAADPDASEARLDALARRALPERAGARLAALELQPLTRINLSGRLFFSPLGTALPAAVAYVLAGLALLLLAVACVNYAGLAVARGLGRTQDVGVRKVLGAGRGTIVAQFLAEALVVGALAGGLALVFGTALAPAFNGLSFVALDGSPLSGRTLLDPALIGAAVVLVVLVAGAAGLYPALLLSRVQPAVAVKARGAATAGGKLWVRKGLAVAQFVAAVVLVVTAFAVARQASLLTDADYGFDTAHTLVVPLGDVPAERVTAWARSQPGVVGATATSRPPGFDGLPDVWLQRSAETDRVEGTTYAVDPAFVGTLGLLLVEGEGPSGRGVVLNETAARALGFGSPDEAVGAPVSLDSLRRDVVGVVADYQAGTAALGVRPAVLVADPARLRWALLRVRPGSEGGVAGALEAASAGLGASTPLRAGRYADELAATGDKALLREAAGVVGLVAGLALAVAALGLLALAAYAVQRRTCEVGVRRVLGARPSDVARLIGREFAALLGGAVVVALPLAVVLNGAWLDLFGRRVGLGPALLGASVLLVAAFAGLAVGSQVWRANRLDLVRALRSE
ncbi:ABC transporter permease [Rubrivirga sp. S365]|uniref:ABC transporter permease n=1 Tax=Rubrivirga sp. S365 TaxID=3076080 RepID=UPI0028CA5256|nr:ABC transporter permease [Rubrivirga sp. S365]MDT7856757.1 ABC transporter permease [Rubrivirga sp. S365]